MSKKDEILRELDDNKLLQLARSVPGSQVDSSTSRSVLTRIILESLSLDEIKQKTKLTKERPGVEESAINELRPGGIGQLLLSVSAIITVVSYTLYLYGYIYVPVLGFSLETLALVGIFNSIIFLLFVILFRVSAKRATSMHGGSRAGTIGAITGFIAFAAGFSYDILTLLGMTTTRYHSYGGYYTGPNVFGVVLPILYSIFFGVTLILIGAFLIAHRKHFLNLELWLLAGIIYVSAGISEVWSALIYNISVITIVAAALGALCFLAGGSTRHPETVKFTGGDLKAGVVGQAFLATSIAILVVGYVIAALSPQTSIFDYYVSLAPWGLVSSAVLLVFGILIRASMNRLAAKVGNTRLATAGPLLAVISAITGILSYGLTISGAAIINPPAGISSFTELGAILLVLCNTLVAITTTLLGAFFLLHHKSGPSSELWIASGLIYIIGGWYAFSSFFLPYPLIPLLVAGCLGAASFLRGQNTK